MPETRMPALDACGRPIEWITTGGGLPHRDSTSQVRRQVTVPLDVDSPFDEVTLTTEVTFTRGRRLMSFAPGLVMFAASASNGAGRGLVWVEQAGCSPQVMAANEFGDRYPDHDRRRAPRREVPNDRRAA